MNHLLRHWNRLWLTVTQWSDDDGGMLAASVAYYIAFALFPMMLVLISLFAIFLGVTGWGQDAQRKFFDQLAEHASPELSQQLGEVLSQAQAQAAVSGPIGAVVLLVAAAVIFVTLQRALDRIWKIEEPSRGIIASVKAVVFGRLKAFLILLMLGLGLLAVFVAGIVLQTIVELTEDRIEVPGGVWSVLLFPFVVVFNTLLLTVLFKAVARFPMRWTDALQGAVLAALIWEAGRQILAAFVIGDRYTAYGVIGSFMAIMLWAYYATAVLLLGAEYIQVLRQQRGEVPPPEEAASPDDSASTT